MNQAILGMCLLLFSALAFAETPPAVIKLQRMITPATPAAAPAQQPQSVTPAVSNLCPNVCENNMMLLRKLEGPQCVAQASSSCFPYRCTNDGKICNTSCMNDSACQAGAHCVNGACVAGNKEQRSCQNDAVLIQRQEGQTVIYDEVIPCFPYRCNASNTRCYIGCQNNLACANGAVCHPQLKQCVPFSYRCESEGGSPNIISADGKVTSCSPYLCKGGVCTSRCSVATDCDHAKGYVCDNGVCLK